MNKNNKPKPEQNASIINKRNNNNKEELPRKKSHTFEKLQIIPNIFIF